MDTDDMIAYIQDDMIAYIQEDMIREYGKVYGWIEEYPACDDGVCVS